MPKIPTGNPPGRPKGSTGISRKEVRALVSDHFRGTKHEDWHPAVQLAEFAVNEDWSPELRASCAKEVLSYMHPKLKAIDHTSEDGEGLKVVIVDATKAPA